MILSFGAGPLTTVLTEAEAAQLAVEAAQLDYNPEEAYTPIASQDAATATPGAPLSPLFTVSPSIAPWPGAAPLVRAVEPAPKASGLVAALPYLAVGGLALVLLRRKS